MPPGSSVLVPVTDDRSKHVSPRERGEFQAPSGGTERSRTMTADTLKSYSCKDLAEMAKKRGVQGWHGMRKEQLVKALLRVNRPKSRPPAARGAKSSTAQLRSASADRAGVRKDQVAARP